MFDKPPQFSSAASGRHTPGGGGGIIFKQLENRPILFCVFFDKKANPYFQNEHQPGFSKNNNLSR